MGVPFACDCNVFVSCLGLWIVFVAFRRVALSSVF